MDVGIETGIGVDGKVGMRVGLGVGKCVGVGSGPLQAAKNDPKTIRTTSKIQSFTRATCGRNFNMECRRLAQNFRRWLHGEPPVWTGWFYIGPVASIKE